MSDSEKKRTAAQNAALHQWLTEIAVVYNNHGITLNVLLEALNNLEVECTKDNIKHSVFKPILEKTVGHESTADARPTDYTPIVQAITKATAQGLGITLPAWPSWHRQDQ